MKAALLLLLFSRTAFADCGTFDIKAQVEHNEKGLFLLVNPKTKSQITLGTEIEEGMKLTPYVNRMISAIVKISKELDETKGTVDEISDIKEIVADPLAPGSGTSFKMKSKNPCKKN